MEKRAVILNSRQSLEPTGSDRWIVQTRRAVQYVKSREYMLVTSVGMSSWEMTLFFASYYGVCREVLIPCDRTISPDEVATHYAEQFHLDNSLTVWNSIPCGHTARELAVFQSRRDRMAIERADIVFPVAVRAGGNLERLLYQAESNGKTVDRTFRTVQPESERSCRIVIDSHRLTPDVDARLDGHIVHWTRTCHKPWPGESSYDYYDAISSGVDSYPRRALDTLCRILSERRLRASSRHQRQGIWAVAFSAQPPSEAIKLMTWRARYREMTFEPYGLAIESSLADKLEIRRVFYGNPDMYGYLEPENRDYFQSLGLKGNWMPEREYRHLGDVDVRSIPSGRLIAVVLYPEDVDTVRRVHDGPVLSLYD